MVKKLVLVAGVATFGATLCLIAFFVIATMTPSTTAPVTDDVPAVAEELKAKPSKASKDLKTEAELRARIAELEAQVKTLQGSKAPAPAKTATTKPAVVPAVDRAAGWRTIASWRGSGIKNTESFTTTAREWRIKWNTGSSGPFGGILQIYVYDSDGGLVNVAANATSSGSDVSYVRARPGRYNLTINSTNDNWSVMVEQEQ